MKTLLLNENWTFEDKSTQVKANVSIPHTVKLEPLNVYSNYMGTFNYTRDMSDVVSARNNDRVFVEFQGVMINCKVYYNEQLVCQHFGGYLPFIIDVTDYISDKNVMRVEVVNYDDNNTPPGKETSGLDFLYYGGIYRDVVVHYKPNLYITYPLERVETGGGITILHNKSDEGKNIIDAKINIENKSNAMCSKIVKLAVIDGNTVIAEKSIEFNIMSHSNTDVLMNIDCGNVIEWDVDSPYLYNIRVSIDDYYEDIEYGFRTVSVDSKGLYLNGKAIDIFGVNRHQQYPYIGIASSSEAERREARLLKATGINILRLAHYPQSPAFLSECARIGMLVIDCVPGWQYRGGSVWQERLLQCVSDMVRRDRNTASVIMFEVTPNETHWPTMRGDKYYIKLREEAKSAMPNCIVSGDTEGRRNGKKVGFDVPYSGKDKLTAFRKLYGNNERKFLKREYGDWGFGGNKSTSRVDVSSGDLAMTQQAFNFQWDRNHTYEVENILGDILWEGIDHNRGYYPDEPISKSGILNIFRRPKFSYHWVKSQCEPKTEYTMFPAISECADTKTFIIYSNCASIAIIDNGTEISWKTADNGDYHYFDRDSKTIIPDNYWALGQDHISVSNKNCPLAVFANRHLFDGGDCQNINYPPFTCKDVEFSGGIVEFIGYDKDGKQVASSVEYPYSKAISLEIEVVTRGIELLANDNDWVWLYVKAVDSNGCIDYKYSAEVAVSVAGGSVIYTDKINAEAGVATFMLKANSAEVNITAVSENMSVTHKMNSVK